MASTINATAHGLSAGDAFRFANVLPTDSGVSEDTTYYVLASGLTANAFQFSETAGGAAFTLTNDITSCDLVGEDTYEEENGDVMTPPDAPSQPTAPTVSSDILTSASGAGAVRLLIGGLAQSAAPLRVVQVQVTREYSGATPVWNSPQNFALSYGEDDLAPPAIGSTKYAVRVRAVDVYGQASAWSTIVEHTTLAGPDSVSLDNIPSTVTIDDTGITILDGSLTIEDAFGETTLTSVGFEGSWEDFTQSGLYNSKFRSSIIAPRGSIPMGTTGMPYWNLTDTGAGTPTVLLNSDTGLEVLFSEVDGELTVDSVFVPVLGGAWYATQFRLQFTIGAGEMFFTPYIVWADEDGTYISTTTLDFYSTALTVSAFVHEPSVVQAPQGAHYAHLYMEILESTTHHANNRAWVYNANLRQAPPANLGGFDLIVGSLNASTGITGTLYGGIAFDGENSDVTLSTIANVTYLTNQDTATPARLEIECSASQEAELVFTQWGTSDIRLRRDASKTLAIDADGTNDVIVTIGGRLDVSGEVEAAQYQVSAFISPTALSANVNNYDPTDGGTAGFWRLSSDATPRTITGIVGPPHVDGMMLYLFNINSSTSITIAHESGSSTSVNRILCPGSANLTLRANGGLLLMYDLTSQRWRAVAE